MYMTLSTLNVQPIETFYVLDFDRCLGRTDSFQALLEKTLEDWSVVDLDMVRYAHKEVKKTGGSFDNAHFIRQSLNDRQLDGAAIWQQIETAYFAAASQQDMFEPHAEELLDSLNTRAARYGILTFGGEQWQTLKIKVAGLGRVPHMIVSHKAKGRLIASWQQLDDTFIIPAPLAGDHPVRAKRVVLIDDKPLSFEGIPPEVVGICVGPRASEAEIAALPTNVKVVKDMAGAKRELAVLVDKT